MLIDKDFLCLKIYKRKIESHIFLLPVIKMTSKHFFEPQDRLVKKNKTIKAACIIAIYEQFQEFRRNCSNYNLRDHIPIRFPRPSVLIHEIHGQTELTPAPFKKIKTRSHSAWSGSRQYLQKGLNHPGFTFR